MLAADWDVGRGMRGSKRRGRSTGWVWGERDGVVKASFPFPGTSIWAHRRTLFIKTGTVLIRGPRLGADIQKRSFEHKHFEVPVKFPTEAANGEFNILAAIQARSRAGIAGCCPCLEQRESTSMNKIIQCKIGREFSSIRP